MTEPLIYIERTTGKESKELVYGAKALHFLYGKGSFWSRLIGRPLVYLVSRFPLFSILYGYLQRLPSSKKKSALLLKLMAWIQLNF